MNIIKKLTASSLCCSMMYLIGFSGVGNTFCDRDTAKQPVKVGAWYFGGWSFPADESGNTFHISPSLVNDFAEREPLWGWREDEAGTMEKQIDYAVQGGLSFWGFCWYENTLLSPVEIPLMDKLNNALDLFLKSDNRNQLDFFLLSCHPVSEANWDILSDKAIGYFQESNYLKVDGKPIVAFFNAEEVITGMGGIEQTNEALGTFRQKAKEAGYDEILIGARTVPSFQDPSFQHQYEACGFDFLTTYNNANEGRKNAGTNDYSDSLTGDRLSWDGISGHSPLTLMPVVGAGYDMRPWAADHPNIPSSDFWFTGVCADRIAHHVGKGIEWVERNSERVLGNLLVVYAWNENGEGAWLTPTQVEGTARLDAIADVVKKPRGDNTR